jgi:hypothetical protein
LRRPGESWTTARELMEAAWPRYARAGLLPAAPPGPRAPPRGPYPRAETGRGRVGEPGGELNAAVRPGG